MKETNVAGNRLGVGGKREAEKRERSYGSFTRAFTLPDGIDPAAIHAELRDGR